MLVGIRGEGGRPDAAEMWA
ncbi:unnamed protein product [Linum tenue]|uniref:Uncharacterized protein n=1 Tax=Linum tenue TaxID=586396 RepID=A0AAV0P7W7_9ROSI|nr:unnamed protein product [Linum tenue]